MEYEYNFRVQDHINQGSIANFMYRVYGWMSIALAISAGVAYYIATQPAIYTKLFTNNWLLFGIILGQFALVVALSAFIMRMSYETAIILFMLYAAALGITLSSIFLVYKISSIYLTFAVTAGMFGIMSLYGYFTKTDLTTVRNLSTMALIGIIIGFLVNMFLQNEMMDYILSGIGVLVFTALTAADTQKIKQMAYQLLGTDQTMKKVSILGAMMLYLDFINLFLLLLRFMGQRKE
jgi:FtsH-binding integral membrane protein